MPCTPIPQSYGNGSDIAIELEADFGKILDKAEAETANMHIYCWTIGNNPGNHKEDSMARRLRNLLAAIWLLAQSQPS